MSEITKGQRKQLRKLAGLAYSRELDTALDDLGLQFEHWRAKQIDGFRLSEIIHEFHDGISRELYKRYNYLSPAETVARALALGILRPDEVPEAIRQRLQRSVELFKEVRDGG
jgi:hypothetical protein